MTTLGLAAAAALMVAVSGSGDVSTRPGASADNDRHGARVIEARVGYFRRDLGNDPAFGNYQHYDRTPDYQYRRTRGFRSYPPPTYEGAGVILFYDGGHSYSVNPGWHRHDRWHHGK